MSDLRWPAVDAARVVATALDEDLGPQGLDVTTMAVFDGAAAATAQVVARAEGMLSGGPVVPVVVAEVTRRLRAGGEVALAADPVVQVHLPDGSRLTRGDVVATIAGPVVPILMAERTLLNIASRLSGVATHTARWADALAGTGATVLDTRKTTPGLRALEKYAVRCGGGTNKRLGLYDVAMVKDNHKLAAGSVAAAYRAIRARFPEVAVEVEVTTLDEALEALAAGSRFLMCDNMSVPQLEETVAAVRAWAEHRGERVEIEATGGLSLEVAADYAATGVDYLSVGGLTHSSPVLDLALDVVDPA